MVEEAEPKESAMPAEYKTDRAPPKKGDKMNQDLPSTPKKQKEKNSSSKKIET